MAVAAVFFAVQIVRVYTAPAGRTATPPRAATAVSPASRAAPAADARPGVTSYASIAAKNLFHPRRSDVDGIAGATTPLGPKPLLHGVVLRDEGSIAYLEDPASKRVTGYKVGDTIAGATVQSIATDRVVLKRTDGTVDVRLRDPAKPRQVAETHPPTQPGASAQPPGAPVRPQLVPPGPGAQIPGAPPVPPTVLRRLPMPTPPRDDSRP